MARHNPYSDVPEGVVRCCDADSERCVILCATSEPDAGLAQFLLDNVDAPDVWEAVRVILSGDAETASTGGGAAITTRYFSVCAWQDYVMESPEHARDERRRREVRP